MMTELTTDETKNMHQICDTILRYPHSYLDAIQHFSTEGKPSFEYNYLIQRIKISAAQSQKSMMKTLKEIKMELNQTPVPAYPYEDAAPPMDQPFQEADPPADEDMDDEDDA